MFDWLKSRAALVAEVREAREQGVTAAHFAELDVDRLIRQRDHFAQELTDTRHKLHAASEGLETAIRQRDSAWARIKELRHEEAGVVGQADPFAPPAPRTATAELLAERARADQLAELVARLQAANMAAGCRHGIPLVEGSARA